LSGVGTRTLPPGQTRGDEGALAAVLPAGSDGSEVLFTDRAPPEHLLAAPIVVVSIMSAPRLLDGGSRAADAVLRLAAHTVSGTRSARAALRLRRLGFPNVQVIRWDHRQPFPRPGRPLPTLPPWHPHRYPRRALVLATRHDTGPTVLDTALAAAGAPEPDMVRASEATLIAITDSTVLRVAVGAGRSQVLRPVGVGEHLLRERPDAVLADRMPWIQGHGTVGVGAWSAERRLHGTGARPPLPASVLEDCRAVLVELFRLGSDGGVPLRSCTADLHRIAAAVPPDAAAAAARLAAGADRVLADLPRGFGHGDFWFDNLLVDSGQLTGVIDWDSAGPGRLPLLDLLHLLLSARQSVPGYRWGNALLDVLRPWADRGADDLGRRYCHQLELSTEPAVLRALVIAYWLDWLHYQFDRYADRSSRTRWMANNVVRVARTLDAAGWAQR
jgi:hypothetical protein